MLTLKQWLERYGQEPCNGCYYNNATRAHCSYKKGYCVRYDEYRADEKKRRPQQLNLFDND